MEIGGEASEGVSLPEHDGIVEIPLIRLTNGEAPTDTETEELLESVKGFSPRERAVVLLKYAYEQTDDDIAEVLNTAPAGVRLLLSRALVALKNQR